MARILSPWDASSTPSCFFLARCTRHELVRQIEFFKAEYQILRSRITTQYVNLNPEERKRLFDLATALQHLISVVSYQTFCRWRREDRKQKPIRKNGGPPRPSRSGS
jgi:hypothetical protein